MDENNNNELLKCNQELSNTKNQLLYLNAEFDNFRKRTEKEKSAWLYTAQATVLLDVLNVLDDLDRALDAPLTGSSNLEALEIIKKSFEQFLKKYNVQEIQEAQSFDPNLHEALMNVKSESHEPGQVVTVLQKGYRFKNQVLRPAKVTVAE